MNARLLGLGDETGTVEAGKSADLIVVDANPLDDLSALRDVRHVMCRGAFVERPRVKHIAELVRRGTRLDHVPARCIEPSDDRTAERLRDPLGGVAGRCASMGMTMAKCRCGLLVG